MAKSANEVYRDYVTSGVPASGLYYPPKADIRGLLTALEASIGSRAPDLLVVEQRTAGTDGGSFNSGAWRTRALNTILRDDDDDVEFDTANNTLTLPAGIWYVEASAAAYQCDAHALQLYKAATDEVLAWGEAARAGATADAMTVARVSAVLTVTADTDIILQHRCETTKATTGLGKAANLGVPERYADLKVWSVGDLPDVADALVGGAETFRFVISNTGNPTEGQLGFNEEAIAGSTQLVISNFSKAGTDISALMADWAARTSEVKIVVRVAAAAEPELRWVTAEATAVTLISGNRYALTIRNLVLSNTLTPFEDVFLTVERVGDRGSTGAAGPSGQDGVAFGSYKGLYNSGTTYALADVVKATDGLFYISNVGSNLNHDPPASATQWAVYPHSRVANLSLPFGGNVQWDAMDGATAPFNLGVWSAADDTNPHGYFGYNVLPRAQLINESERGLIWGIEGDYDDGSGHNKMEFYVQYQLASDFSTGGVANYRRSIMGSFDKVTHLPFALILSGGGNGVFFNWNDGSGESEQEQVVGKIKAFYTHEVWRIYNQIGVAETPIASFDSSAADAVTGLLFAAKAEGDGFDLALISSAASEDIRFNALGAGKLTLQNDASGLVEIKHGSTITIPDDNEGSVAIALTVGREGGDSGDVSAREAAIAFYDASNPTLTAAISGVRLSPSGDFTGGMAFYVNNAGTAADTIAELSKAAAINASRQWRWHGYGAGTLTTDASGNITASSDATMKDVAGEYLPGLAEILKIAPKRWKWKPETGLDSENEYAGPIAQDVEAAGLTHAVWTQPDGKKSLIFGPIIAALINAVKEQAKQIEELKRSLGK